MKNMRFGEIKMDENNWKYLQHCNINRKQFVEVSTLNFG